MRELNITQSAMTRKIRALEEHLGTPLFARHGRAVRLSGDGEKFLDYAQDMLRGLDRVRSSIGDTPQGIFRIGVLPSLGVAWLIPRLAAFRASFPKMPMEITTIDADFSLANKDPVNWDPAMLSVVLTWGHGGWRGLSHEAFAKETMVPVAAPAFLRQRNIRNIADVLSAPRLEHTTRSNAWESWASALKLTAPSGHPEAVLRFEHFFMLREAAKAGLGIALMPDLLVETEIEEGHLEAIADGCSKTGAAYFMVARQRLWQDPVVAAFRAFLRRANVKTNRSDVLCAGERKQPV